jgi:hypothetical protein
MRPWGFGLALIALTATMACGGGDSPTSVRGADGGAERTMKTAALETGAALLQDKEPVDAISMYLNGFHVAKGDPAMQMEAHHYCNQVNEDLAQCVLFDGNTRDARMTGVEYIISERLYARLPADERAYWHPHNYEVLSGQLRLPGLPDVVEREALETKINSYGKTWHTWMAGMFDGSNDPLPYGPAVLQWSFNYDGEERPGMVEARDKRMGLDTADARRDRAGLTSLARPQGGVDAMRHRHSTSGTPLPGVVDNGDTSTRGVVRMTMEK